MIELKNISYQVAGKPLLDDISLSFPASGLNLLIGPNGAGKSTLIRILSAELKASKGQLLLDGREASSIKKDELARIRAVLSQSIDLAFPMKVSEVVMMGRYPHFGNNPASIDIQAVNEAMDLFNLAGFADRDYSTLSGGEKQRVHFARVFAQIWFPAADSQRYLFLDEPLTFLDVQHQHSFMHKIRELLKAKDLTVVGVVHDLNLAARFADQITLMDKGKLLASGEPSKVLTKENIRRLYGLDPWIMELEGKMHVAFK